MTGGFTRGVGALILALCSWWAFGALTDVASVSPVHWGLLLPHLAVTGFPAVIATFTAGAMLFGRAGARALALALAVATAQAAAVSYLAPEIGARYDETVTVSKTLQRDSAFGLRRTP